MTLLVASLSLLIAAFLFGSAVYVLSRDPFARTNQAYALLALAQLGWVGTLFVFGATGEGPALLWLGRANFAAAVLVTPAVYVFVRALIRRPVSGAGWIAAETLGMSVLSLFTGLIDHSEAVRAGLHVTEYGVLFPLYIAHLLAYLVPALWQALVPPRDLPERQAGPVRLVGIGLLATACLGLLADVVLPYGFGSFKWIDAGTLSTVGALAAIAYAASVHHLFANVRLVVKAAIVFAVLVAFALELYQVAIGALATLLPLGDPTQRHVAAAAVALTVNAFTQHPLRLWLERLADRLIAGTNRQGRRSVPGPQDYSRRRP